MNIETMQEWCISENEKEKMNLFCRFWWFCILNMPITIQDISLIFIDLQKCTRQSITLSGNIENSRLLHLLIFDTFMPF